MSTKAEWAKRDVVQQPSQPELPVPAEAIVIRARALTEDEVRRLDLADNDGRGELRRVAWDVLRDTLDHDPATRAQRLAARDRAWAAVPDAALRVGLAPVPGDGYWQVVIAPGAGAARAARHAACSRIGEQIVEAEVLEILRGPWSELSRSRD